MTASHDPRKYSVDYDWLWTRPPHNDGTPATVRLTLTDGRGSRAHDAVDAWLASLGPAEDGMYGQAGWVVVEKERRRRSVVLEITSGGEDVADGIDDGTDAAYRAVIEGTDLEVTWEQLPREGC
ncbi:hypothetical protein [Trueperella pecoris]|uniref:hypothetical protein n=1 Tax=Trueperella pecoris TaxID=2733571 RepID=UPI00186B602C|nr:hypothetical protein [Trueperella pecoris]QOQ38036.1 hypothetical protein HLG82_00295 [Trueperella pecoris]QTG75362.1 hypothetical protein J4179_09165 [Trueperella pecoris]